MALKIYKFYFAPKIYKLYFAPDDAWNDNPMWFRLPYKRFMNHIVVKIKLFGIFTIYDRRKEQNNEQENDSV